MSRWAVAAAVVALIGGLAFVVQQPRAAPTVASLVAAAATAAATGPPVTAPSASAPRPAASATTVAVATLAAPIAASPETWLTPGMVPPGGCATCVVAGQRYDSMSFSEPFEFVMPVSSQTGSWANGGVTERSLRNGVLYVGNSSSWWSAFLDDVPVFADICDAGRGLLDDIPTTPEDVGAWLRSSLTLTVGDPISIMVDGRTAIAFPTTDHLGCGLSRAWFSNAGVVYAIPTGDDTILYTVWSDGGDWPANEFPDELVRSITFN